MFIPHALRIIPLLSLLMACASAPPATPDAQTQDAAPAPEQATGQEKTILFVMTSHDQLGETGKSTGYFLSEAAHVWHIAREANVRVRFASVRGGTPPMDGVKLDDPINLAFTQDPQVQAALMSAPALREVQPDGIDAIYFPGGHGTMWDFPDDPDVQRLTRAIYERGGVVAAVCHGPAALVNVTLSDGSYLVAGKRVAAFTDDEERAAGLEQVVPFLLSSALRERGALLVSAPNYEAQISVDGRLITGQNPASASPLGEALVAAVEAAEVSARAAE